MTIYSHMLRDRIKDAKLGMAGYGYPRLTALDVVITYIRYPYYRHIKHYAPYIAYTCAQPQYH